MKTSSFELVQVNPQEIHAVWGKVREYVEIVGKETSAAWLPEDVYSEIKSGRALLFVNTPVSGCLVIQPKTDTWSGEKFLNVWIAYSENFGAIKAVLPEIEKMARAAGIKRITCTSPYAAFEKWFKPLVVTYERLL